MVLLNTLTASSSASLQDTSSLTATYSSYLLVFENIVPASNAQLELLVHSGGSFQTTSYLMRIWEFSSTTANTTPTTFFALTATDFASSAAGSGFSGFALITAAASAAIPKNIISEGIYTSAGAIVLSKAGGYWNGSNAAIDGFEIALAGGVLLTSGVVKVYGIL